MHPPIIYSFRRCPYAMRARLALKYADIKVELREVDLNNPPDSLIAISDNATVPVLHLPDGNVLDESWDIVQWAARQNDPDSWMGENNQYQIESDMLLETNDYSFKQDLDHYKYADRYPEHTKEYYREHIAAGKCLKNITRNNFNKNFCETALLINKAFGLTHCSA